eukprot:5936883-Amphidinium_carterae.1
MGGFFIWFAHVQWAWIGANVSMPCLLATSHRSRSSLRTGPGWSSWTSTISIESSLSSTSTSSELPPKVRRTRIPSKQKMNSMVEARLDSEPQSQYLCATSSLKRP